MGTHRRKPELDTYSWRIQSVLKLIVEANMPESDSIYFVNHGLYKMVTKMAVGSQQYLTLCNQLRF